MGRIAMIFRTLPPTASAKLLRHTRDKLRRTRDNGEHTYSYDLVRIGSPTFPRSTALFPAHHTTASHLSLRWEQHIRVRSETARMSLLRRDVFEVESLLYLTRGSSNYMQIPKSTLCLTSPEMQKRCRITAASTYVPSVLKSRASCL